jgi:hypothetical protein
VGRRCSGLRAESGGVGAFGGCDGFGRARRAHNHSCEVEAAAMIDCSRVEGWGLALMDSCCWLRAASADSRDHDFHFALTLA